MHQRAWFQVTHKNAANLCRLASASVAQNHCDYYVMSTLAHQDKWRRSWLHSGGAALEGKKKKKICSWKRFKKNLDEDETSRAHPGRGSSLYTFMIKTERHQMIDDVRADRIKCVSELPRFGHASSQNPSEDKSKGQMSPWELRLHSCRDRNLFCRYSLLTSRKNRKTCGDSSSHNIWISSQVCICEATALAPNQPRSLKYERDWTYAAMVWEAEPTGASLPEYWAQHTGAKRPCITPVLKDVTSTVKQLFGTSAPVKKRASWILTLPPTVCMRSVGHD